MGCLIDASIPEWNSMCTATCGASTTETGGSSSDNCANHTDKRKTRVRMIFFSVLPTSQFKIAEIELRAQFWRVFYTSVKIQNRKNVGISNDFDMTHVSRNANYQGSLTTPVSSLQQPFF